MKEEIKGDDELREAFAGDTAADVLRGSNRRARAAFVRDRLQPYQQEFGYKAIWSHEFVFPTWRENPAPIIEAIRGYLETDYDYPAAIGAVKQDLEGAIAELMDGVPEGEDRDRLQAALDMSLRMNPLTPDHHFYIDQGTNARLRLVAIAIGCKLTEAGLFDDPEDAIYLRYNELRVLMANPEAFDARRSSQTAATSASGRRWSARPSGSGPRPRRRSPSRTSRSGAFPRSSTASRRRRWTRCTGSRASPGVVEGTARTSPRLTSSTR